MKRIAIMMMCVATLAMSACSALTAASSSNAAASASGSACGSAVQGLYSAYKSSGKVDLGNATNLSNAVALASAYTNLKNNKSDSDYRKAFTSGLIASSAGLVTQSNASTFINQLLSTSSLGNINTQTVSQTAATASAIVTLLNTLKQ
ncbi:MAG: hypothetical protein IJU19_08210 [Bacteroidales bacterium]|nr:hypothetical protein [Bacteroidales bacterium]